MQISPKQLRRAVSGTDHVHRDAMRAHADDIGELHVGCALGSGRRSFLKKVVAGGAAVSFGSALAPVSHLVPVAGAQQLDDRALAAFAESVELALVAVYDAGAPLLSSELLPVAETFLGHHQEHADAFADLAGDAATGRANAALMEVLTPTIEGLAGQGDVLAFAMSVENQVVATYAWALTTLESTRAASLTATILPIESAHAAALGLTLGEGPEVWFPTGAFESGDLALGLDPAVFPVG